MTAFLKGQMDYIYFLYGLSFLILAAMSLILWTKKQPRIAWYYLALFGLVHGINEWVLLAGIYTGHPSYLNHTSLVLTVISFLFLGEFGRKNTVNLTGKKISIWFLVAVFIFVLFGYRLAGFSGINIFSRYFLGCLGGVFASATLFIIAKKSNLFAHRWLLIAGIFLGLYALTQSVSPYVEFFPSTIINYGTFLKFFGFPVELLRSILIFIVAASVWIYWWISTEVESQRNYEALPKYILPIIFFVFITIVFGWAMTNFLGRQGEDQIRRETLIRARIIASSLDIADIKGIEGTSADFNKPEFIRLRSQLMSIHLASVEFRFVYLMGFRNGKVFFFADSEPSQSKDYSPPGQIYEEASSQLMDCFSDGKSFIEGPMNDRWGTWISALFPVRDPINNRVIAILGIDIAANNWNSIVSRYRLPGILFTLIICLMTIGFSVFSLFMRESAVKIATSEDRFRMIFEKAPEGVFIFDVNSRRILEANPFMVNFLGYGRPELLNMVTDDLFPGVVIGQGTWGSFGEVNGELIFTQECRCFKKNKEHVDFELTGLSLSFHDKNCILVFVRDVTQRKQIEQILKENEKYYRALIENALDIVTIINENATIIYQSYSCVNVLGYHPEDLVGKNALDFIYQEDIPRLQKVLMEIIQVPDSMKSEEFRFRHRDGSWRILEAKGQNRLNDPQIKGIVINSRDISGRREDEEKIRKLSRAVEQSPSSVVITDTSGNIEYVNPKFTQVTGYSPQEVFGKNPRILKSGEMSPEEYKTLWSAITSGREWRGVFHNKRKNGELFWEAASISPIRNQDGMITHFLGVKEDITNQKKMEQDLVVVNQDLVSREKELRKTLADLEAAHHALKSTQNQLLQSEKLAAIGQLAAGIAHEINNPLGYISSNLEILKQYINSYSQILLAIEKIKTAVSDKNIAQIESISQEIGDLKKKNNFDFIVADIENLLRESKNGVEHIKKIITDLRAFSRTDKDVITMANIEEVLEGIVNIVWNEIKYKAELKKEYAGLPLIKCNPQHLGQVFINILVNAVQAIQEKGVISIRTFFDKNHVFIEFSDTGMGISQEHISKIFDPFFTTKPVGKGTGLGLSISYEIVKRHGGTIEVESEPGRGTKFTVILPREKKA